MAKLILRSFCLSRTEEFCPEKSELCDQASGDRQPENENRSS